MFTGFCTFRPHLRHMDNYYKILGLRTGASKQEIKKAYRKMAKRYHPDVNPGEDSEKKFIQVLEAYNYLMGERKQRKKSSFDYAGWQAAKDNLKKEAEEKAKREFREKAERMRKKRDAEQAAEYKKAIYIFFGIVLVLFCSWQGYGFYKNLVLGGSGVTTDARVKGFSTKRTYFEFVVDGQLVTTEKYTSQLGNNNMGDNGMPLKSGDVFEITYSPSSPGLNEINYQKVSSKTMFRYLEQTMAALKQVYAKEWVNLSEAEQNRKARCMCLLIIQEYGIEGLAMIVGRDYHILSYFKANSLKWYFRKRSSTFKEIVENCNGKP